MEVFTPDGTYSAFGDTYPLVDFPALVAAAPKGLFMVGPPVLELDGDEGTGQQPLCFVDQTDPRHAHRVLHRHLPPHRSRLATAHPVHDLPAQERGPGLGAGPRPDPARPDAPPDGAAGVPVVAWTPGSREHEAELTPVPGARGDARRARWTTWPPVKRLDLRGRLDALGMARAGRRARGVHTAARLPGRGADLPGPGGAGHLLHDRGAGPDHDRLRRAGAGRRHGPPAAAGRRDMVPGLLGARAPGATWPPCRAGPPGTATSGGSPGRRSGPAWPSTPTAACSSPAPAPPSRPTRGSPPCSSTWTAPASTCGPSRPCTAPRSSPRSSSTTSSYPSTAPSAEEGQGWSVAMDLLPYERSTALWHRAAYLHRRLQGLLDTVPPDALDPAAVGEVAQLLYALRARSRATQHRLAAGEHLGPETSVDKVLVATAEQARVRPRGRRAGSRGDRRRRPRQRPVAPGVPLLPGRHHLRRRRRRSSGTSSPGGSSTSERAGDGRRRPLAVRAVPPPRLRSRPAGRPSTDALDELGWHEALSARSPPGRVVPLRGRWARPTPARRPSTPSSVPPWA